MIGSNGERMLRITAPHVDAWNSWYADTANTPAGIAPLRDKVDAAAREAGRDPAAIERSVAVQVRMPGGTGRTMGDSDAKQDVAPLQGSPDAMAEELRAYAREGIGHVQLVLDPITRQSIEGFAPVLALLDGG
jgi:alkanesulfonate monooxygenase SsuD/methylene tetrahydromethanopterin reductase-like flavin-dependent oxidoreductase (luciferase family)